MPRRCRPVGILLVAALAGACASTSTAGPATPTTTASTTTASTTTTVAVETGSTDIGRPDRPARLVAPEEVTAPAPLLIVLHGYTSTGAQHDSYFSATQQAASRGLYVLLPDGTSEPETGKQFWDASPACCNFTGTPVDDVAYLSGLIDEAIATRPIDPERIYVIGHSNGGFMAYRLACDIAEKVTAIAVLSGSDQPTEADCTPSRPVSVLHMHGTADGTIGFGGGQITASFPGAVETMARWAKRDGCDATPTVGPAIDLDAGIPGAETRVSIYGGCEAGIDVQLDTIEGGAHSPTLVPESVGTDVFDWLLAHTG